MYNISFFVDLLILWCW